MHEIEYIIKLLTVSLLIILPGLVAGYLMGYFLSKIITKISDKFKKKSKPSKNDVREAVESYNRFVADFRRDRTNINVEYYFDENGVARWREVSPMWEPNVMRNFVSSNPDPKEKLCDRLLKKTIL